MKVLSSLFLIGVLCFAITFQTRSHHIWEPDKYFGAIANAASSDHNDKVFMKVSGNVSAEGVELGGYYISSSGIATEPKNRRFCGSASASISKSQDGFFHVSVTASIGGRFYDGRGDADWGWDEAGPPPG